MKEELDLEEKTDVELVGVPTEEAAGSPGAEEAEPSGGCPRGMRGAGRRGKGRAG